MSKFLTLEGAPCHHPSLLGTLLDAPRPAETATTRAAFAARQDAASWAATDEADRQSAAYMKRLEAMMKSTEDAPGIDQKRGLFAQYGLENGLNSLLSLGEEMADDGDEGLGFWKRLRRAFTPPARVRRILKRVATPPKAIRKAVRYAGAAHFTLLTGGFASGKANKMFGIKPSEQKFFNIAAKLTRVGTIAVATVVGGPAIIGGMGKTAGAALSKLMAKGAFKMALNKGAKFLVKDAVKGQIWSLAKNAAGQIIGQKFNKSQISPEEYAALPADIPVPVEPRGMGMGGGGGGATSGGGFAPEQDDSAIEPEMAPSVAGSSTMTPGEQDTPPGYQAGEFMTDPGTRAFNSAPNPLGSFSRVNPLIDDSQGAKDTSFDEASIEELTAKEAPAAEPDSFLKPTDEDLSLAFDEAISRARARQRNGIVKNRPSRKNLLWGKLA